MEIVTSDFYFLALFLPARCVCNIAEKTLIPPLGSMVLFSP